MSADPRNNRKSEDTSSGAEFQRLVDKLFWPDDDHDEEDEDDDGE